MEISNSGLSLITRFEGCKLTAYPDSGEVWTIGYGHAGPDVCEGMTITEDQALDFLRQDTAVAQRAVNRYVTADLTQNQFDALVDFTYNLGSGHLHKSTLLGVLNQGDYDRAADEFLKWDTVGGVAVAGLTRRRRAERDLFVSS